MTDIKKLRELAEKATPWPKHFAVEDTFPTIWLVDKNGERHDIMNDDLIFWEAANPQAIIEILDRLERYEKALEMIRERDEEFYVREIEKWQFAWMNVTGTTEEDSKNYRERSRGIDANMRYDLARRLVGVQRIEEEK